MVYGFFLVLVLLRINPGSTIVPYVKGLKFTIAGAKLTLLSL